MTTTTTLNGQVIGQAERATRALLDVLLAETNTPFVSWVSVNLLATRSGTTADDLVDQLVTGLRISESEARAAIDEIMHAGLATGAPTLGLTAMGDATYRRISHGIDRISHRLYDDLPVDDLVAARRVLETVTERARAELARASVGGLQLEVEHQQAQDDHDDDQRGGTTTGSCRQRS